MCRWVWKKWNGPKQLEDKKTRTLMMLPYVHFTAFRFSERLMLRPPRTDYVLTQDKNFKKWAKAYADDEALWFKEYVP